MVEYTDPEFRPLGVLPADLGRLDPTRCLFEITVRNADDNLTPPSSPLRRVIEQAATLADQFQEGAASIDRDGAFPRQEFRDLHEAGLLAAPLAHHLGGSSLGMVGDGAASQAATYSLLRVLEEIGRGNLAVGRLYEGHVNALLLVQQFGSPGQVERWATDARAGKIFGVWNSQGADGVRFGAADSRGQVELQGGKSFASGAGQIARPIVTGALPNGFWQMAVVPIDEVEAQVDTSWWRPLGMRASASHRVDFRGVWVDREACFLGEPGSYLREPWFSGGAIRFAAVQLGGARALLDATVETLRRLGRADDPYQRSRVGTMAIAVESGRQWLRAAAEVADRVGVEPSEDVVAATITHAQMTRTALEAICQQVLLLAEQSVGAGGLIRPHPIERIGRDLTLYLRQPGPDSTLAQVGQARLEGLPDRRPFDLDHAIIS